MILGLDVCTDKWVESGSPCDISCHRLVDTPFVGSLHIYYISSHWNWRKLCHNQSAASANGQSHPIYVLNSCQFLFWILQKSGAWSSSHTHIYILYLIYIYMTKNNEDHQQVLFLFSRSLVETSGLGYRMCEDQMSPKCATRLELSASHQALTI